MYYCKATFFLLFKTGFIIISHHTSPRTGMLVSKKVLRLIWDEICKVEPNPSINNKFMIMEGDNYYSKDLVIITKTKQLLQIKMDDEGGFATAAKLNRIQVDQFQENQQITKTKQQEIDNQKKTKKMSKLNLNINSKQEQFEQNNEQMGFHYKIKNHLKVYQKAKDSIDEIINTLQNFQSEKEEHGLSWMLQLMKKKKNAESEQCITDQQEVIEAGPLPSQVNLRTLKKKLGINLMKLFFNSAIKKDPSLSYPQNLSFQYSSNFRMNR